MVVISNLLDSMCSCLSDQACGGAPRYGFAAPPPSEDVQMADAPANTSGPSPTTDGRQSSSGSPTGSTHSNHSSSPRSSPSPSHFLKFRGANGTEWQSLVRRTSCGGAASAGSATSRPSSPSIQDNNSTVMRCLDMDNAQMALAHARQQVGARAHNNHHKRKASSDIFRSRHNAETTSASAESSSSSDEPLQQHDVSSERVASPVPLGGLCAPNLGGVVDNGPLGVRSLLRFPGLCFANPIRGSSSFDDNVNEQQPLSHVHSAMDEADRPASPAYLLEQELSDKQRQPERPMPLYASQQVVPIADTAIDNGPICLTDMIRQVNGNGNDGGAKKMRLTAPSAPAATDAKPTFAFSSSSDEEEEASVESTPATMTEGAEGEAPITPTALDAYGAIGTSTNANTASPTSTNVQSASAPTHQITPNFTPSSSRPHKQQRRKSPGALSGGIHALGSGPSVPELMFAGGHQEEAPVTPGQVPMSAPPGAAANVPVTPEKPSFDV